MKLVKIGKRFFALLLLGGFLFLSVFCNLPYRYPVYPGTPEWETLEVEERWEIGHVPLFRIRMMSTNALLCTFLTHHELFIPLSNGYPLDPTYWLGKGYSTENKELYPIFLFLAQISLVHRQFERADIPFRNYTIYLE